MWTARKWYRIAGEVSEILFGENNIAVMQCGGKDICVALHGDELFAFAYKCPHASGIMANGYIDPLGNVVCPLHRYKFSMRNGRNVSGEGYYLKTFSVEQRPEGIFVEV
jgi:nitrite reductase/ring-hydroxylating ferredoxin subunit